MKLRFLFFLVLIIPLIGFGNIKPEKDKSFQAIEDSLVKLGPAVFKGTNDQKLAANKKFSSLLLKALNTPGAFDYPFDSLKFIGNLIAPDKAFRIFNWDIPMDNGTYNYYGFVFVDDTKTGTSKKVQKGTYTIYELEDKSNDIRNPELSILSCEKWYGALYYQIILKQDKDKKYYTLIGWDGNNSLTWKKVLDALTFSKEGKPIFGEKMIFQRNSRRSSNRVIFEYRGEFTMALHWDEKANAIVFDHLAPEVTGADGMFQFYSADGSYDAYIWKKGKWQMKEDFNATNPSNGKDKNYNAPQGDQNPSGTNNGTAGDQTHKRKRLFKKKVTAPQQ